MDPGRRRSRWTVGISVVLHAAAGVALLGYSFWKIERLSYKDRSLISMPGVLGLPPGEPPPVPGTPKSASAPKRVSTDQLHQPTHAVAKDPAEVADVPSTTGPTNATPTGGPPGGGDGSEGLFSGNGPGGGGGGNPTADIAVDIPAPPEHKVVADTSQKAMEALRVGDGRILLPASLLAALKAQGQTQLSVTVKICLDARGVPTSQALLVSSSIAEVDEVVLAGTAAWRFSPYTVDGQPVRACFPATINYTIK